MLAAPLSRGAYFGGATFDPSAILALDFARNRYRAGPGRGSQASFKGLPGASYTGGAGFKWVRRNGVWVNVAANEPGETPEGLPLYDTRTNSLANPICAGAVLGDLVAGGSLPTGWSRGGGIPPGTAMHVVAIGTEDGLPFIDVRFFGTPENTSQLAIQPSPSTTSGGGIAAASGQTWTVSARCKIVAGAIANIIPAVRLRGYTGVGASTEASATAPITEAALTRKAVTFQLANATTAVVTSQILFAWTNGVPFDVTVRIAAPQIKQGNEIGDPPILQANNLPATRTEDYPSAAVAIPAAWTIFLEVKPAVVTGTQYAAMIHRESPNNNEGVLVYATGGSWYVGASGARATVNSTVPAVAGQVARIAARYSAEDCAISVNGAAVRKDLPGAPFAGPLGRLHLGDHPSTPARALNGELLRASIYPRAFSDDELRALAA